MVQTHCNLINAHISLKCNAVYWIFASGDNDDDEDI